MGQDNDKMAQDGPRWPQNDPKRAQDVPRMAQDNPKTAPKWPKMVEDAAQFGPKIDIHLNKLKNHKNLKTNEKSTIFNNRELNFRIKVQTLG